MDYFNDNYLDWMISSFSTCLNLFEISYLKASDTLMLNVLCIFHAVNLVTEV